MPEQPADATVDFALPEPLARIRELFRSAWDDALRTGSVPDLETFAYQAGEGDRPLLRQSLHIIDQDYRGKYEKLRGSPADTAPTPTSGSDTVNQAGTPKPGSDGTIDLTGTESQKKDEGQQTEELVPRKESRSNPEMTIDFQSGGTVGRDSQHSTEFELSVGDDSGAKQAADYPEVAGYQLMSVLGRGAMGVVYKARQRGLKRIVALKMILSGGHASEHDLARFRSEAEAVGQLQHVNIVQVHEVGEQNGCPFFSLEYVDGGSLNKRIGGNPQPVKAAAELIETLAHAMDFAHKQGIIHRDLKPANVMLTKPRAAGTGESTSRAPTISEQLYGIPKIADFGLAKRFEEDSGQTKSGTILGTPSYMSPEQAAGKTKEVGPLSDIYALGAILYEMLTGRPPFRGETLLDTLEQVRTEEPVPPSRLQPKVPRDLETICLKTLQKEPQKRYATAGELAEDLHRFGLGEPIRARAISARERFWRWCRRNPKIAILSGTVALLLVMVAATSSWFAFQIAAEKEQVEIKHKEAVEARNDAKRKQVEAEAARQVAQEQRSLALGALGVLVTKVQTELAKAPEMYELREGIISLAVKELEKVAQSTENAEGRKDRTMAQALHEMAEIYRKVGFPQKALQQYMQAHEILDNLASEDPASDKNRGNLSLSYTKQGDMCLEMESAAYKAKEFYDKALALQLGILKSPGDYFGDKLHELKRLLAATYSKLGFTVVRLGNPQEAIEHQLKALQLRETALKENPKDVDARLGLPDSLKSLGDLYWRLGDAPKTREYHDRCIKMREGFLKGASKLAAFGRKRDLALAYGLYGHAEMRLGDHARAMSLSQKSLDLFKELADRDSKNVELHGLVATAHYRMGCLALYQGDQSGAKKHFTEALKLHEERVQSDPNAKARMGYVLCLARVGEHEKAADLADKRLQTLDPENHEARFPIACGYALCAAATNDAALKEKYNARAIELLKQAITPNYKDAAAIETDPDLLPILSDPRFQEVMAGVRKNQTKR